MASNSLTIKNAILPLILLFAFHLAIANAALFPISHVWMRNDLSLNSTNTNLTLHCQSKDDDLGWQYLSPGGTFQFSFRPKFIFGVTLFFCRFEWTNSCHYFNIYNQHRDIKEGDHFCWSIQQPGPIKCTCSTNCSLNDPDLAPSPWKSSC